MPGDHLVHRRPLEPRAVGDAVPGQPVARGPRDRGQGIPFPQVAAHRHEPGTPCRDVEDLGEVLRDGVGGRLDVGV